MLSTRVFGLACAVAVFVCLMAAPVSAQPLDKRTLFTFSGPVTLPGVTLPAGQYLFRLADPNSSSKVVQVLNADGTKPYGLFFTIPAERLEPAVVARSAVHGNRIRYACGHSDVVVPRRTEGLRVHLPERTGPPPGDGCKSARADDRRPDDNDRTDEHGGTLAGGLERTGNGRERERRANRRRTPAGTTQEGTIAASSLSIATPSIPAAAVRRSRLQPPQRRRRRPEPPRRKRARHRMVLREPRARVAANGKSASARRDCRHGHSLECGVAAVPADTTTLNTSTRVSIGPGTRPVPMLALAVCYVEGMDFPMIVLVVTTVSAAQFLDAQPPIFSSRAELVVVHATVKDRQGGYVTALPQEAFRISRGRRSSRDRLLHWREFAGHGGVPRGQQRQYAGGSRARNRRRHCVRRGEQPQRRTVCARLQRTRPFRPSALNALHQQCERVPCQPSQEPWARKVGQRCMTPFQPGFHISPGAITSDECSWSLAMVATTQARRHSTRC